MVDWENDIVTKTDKYFTRARKIAENFGDMTVTYAFFIRRPSMVAIQPAIDFIMEHCPEAIINREFVDKSGKRVVNNEGNIVPTGKKIFEVTGPYVKLSELETLILQKVGFTCVTAYNSYKMSKSLPSKTFLDMSARHLTGTEMHMLVAYGCKVGSDRAVSEGAKGFIGTSTDTTSKVFGVPYGIGTIPHALVGYAEQTIREERFRNLSDNGTLRSVQMFVEANPEVSNVVALVDYYGKEITDSLLCSDWFVTHDLEKAGKTFAVRLDTHGGRFAEGLDYKKSVEILEEWLDIGGEYEIVQKVIGTTAFDLDKDDKLIDEVRKILFGTGVSAANIVNTRNQLDMKGFTKTGIVVSSGFNLQKCTAMAAVKAPISTVGTGSFLPSKMSETYTTADIVSYNGEYNVKIGREYLYEENIRRNGSL